MIWTKFNSEDIYKLMHKIQTENANRTSKKKQNLRQRKEYYRFTSAMRSEFLIWCHEKLLISLSGCWPTRLIKIKKNYHDNLSLFKMFKQCTPCFTTVYVWLLVSVWTTIDIYNQIAKRILSGIVSYKWNFSVKIDNTTLTENIY